MADHKITEASEIQWRFAFYWEPNHDNTYTVDFDDISIRYHKGYVNKLVVSSSAASCWGPGSNIHVGTSTYFSWNSLKPNGYNGCIHSIEDKSDGILNIILSKVPQFLFYQL